MAVTLAPLTFCNLYIEYFYFLLSAMPKDLTKENINVGRVIYEWTVQEYEHYDRNRRWYMIMGGVGIALVAYGMLTENYLFALLIILFGIVLYLHDMQTPLQVPFAITETGIIVGRKYYRFSELKNFWLIYNPPEVKNLYFGLPTLIKHRIQIPLHDYDPRPIREFLSQYLTEDLEQEEEPLSDRMARLLKLH